MKTIEAARGNWSFIFDHYGLPPITGNKHYKGECPLCRKKGKFRIDDKDGMGTFVCVCAAGTGMQLLTEYTGKPFKEIAQELDKLLRNEWQSDSRQPTQRMEPVERARASFMKMQPLREADPALLYFSNRGIFDVPSRGIRYCPGRMDKDAGRVVPCLYSIASNEYGEPVYLHLTYIERGAKADVPTQRKMMKLQEFDGSTAIKLADHGAVLGVAEGIETALSAKNIYKINCWSTINATLMKKFRAPTGVRTLYVFADNDDSGTGLAAAFECGRSNLLSRNDVENVVIRWPQTVGDFNDMLIRGDEVCEWRLKR